MTSADTKRLAGKTAIVTGGAKGIGQHYSEALAAAGANVVIADIADGKALADGIAKKHGTDVVSVTFDVSDEDQVRRLVASTVDRFKSADILVNNAAVYSTLPPVKCTDIEVALWDKVMAVNVR